MLEELRKLKTQKGTITLFQASCMAEKEREPKDEITIALVQLCSYGLLKELKLFKKVKSKVSKAPSICELITYQGLTNNCRSLN